MKKRLFIWAVALSIVSSTAVLAAERTFPFVGKINADKVNIRAGQSKNFENIGDLKKGDTVVVVQKNYSWYKIKLPKNAQAYVYRKFVRFLRDQIGEVTGNRVNIRARADLGSAVIGQLSKMTKVKIVETLDEWYRIQPVEGIYGWVSEEFIDFFSDQVPGPVFVQLPTRNIYMIKHQEEIRLQEEEAKRKAEEEKQKITIKGTVRSMQAPVDEHVRHQITADDGQTFYLMGYRSVLDGFLNHRVQIEGLPQDDKKFDHPVLLVTKVSLVL